MLLGKCIWKEARTRGPWELAAFICCQCSPVLNKLAVTHSGPVSAHQTDSPKFCQETCLPKNKNFDQAELRVSQRPNRDGETVCSSQNMAASAKQTQTGENHTHTHLTRKSPPTSYHSQLLETWPFCQLRKRVSRGVFSSART